MKAYTPTGRKILNKICLNCKHVGYKVDMENGELIDFCLKRKVIIDKFGTCREFEFD